MNECKRGFVTSWESPIHRKLKIDDKVTLPTMWGKFTFTVVSIDEHSALLESGKTQARLVKDGNDKWIYNHLTWPKDTYVRMTFSDCCKKLKDTIKSNIGFSKIYK